MECLIWMNPICQKPNNSCEGWHRRFQSNIGAHHPTIWKFDTVLQREESLTKAKTVQLNAGHQPPTWLTEENTKTLINVYRELWTHTESVTLKPTCETSHTIRNFNTLHLLAAIYLYFFYLNVDEEVFLYWNKYAWKEF